MTVRPSKRGMDRLVDAPFFNVPRESRRRAAVIGGHQLASASSARAVMSSTLPEPLILRYLGAAAGSLVAHWL